MKHSITFVFLLIGLCTFGQTDQPNDSRFTIDPGIEEEVNTKIAVFVFSDSLHDPLSIYENILFADYFENDSLILREATQELKMPFRSFFYSRNEIVSIDGLFGMFGGFGFSIKFFDEKPVIYHLLAGDDFPMYSLTEDGELEFRIEVPCANTRLVLSKIPELVAGEVIYGMLEFESGEYYQATSIVEGEEVDDRLKIRMNMQIYFKSSFLDLETMD